MAAATEAAKGTFLGTYRVDQQAAACSKWVKGVPDPNRTSPVTSNIPTLIISGELDPVTPPRAGDEVRKTLRNGLHVVIPKGSHSGDTGGCLERIALEAVREGSVASLDRSCLARIEPPSFAGVGLLR